MKIVTSGWTTHAKMPKMCEWIEDQVSWFPLVCKQLVAISKLKAGWDGDDADKPDERIILCSAYSFLIDLVAALPSDTSKPHVNPTRSGGVQFEWEHGNRYFEIEFIANDEIQCFYGDCWGDRETSLFFGQDIQFILRSIKLVEEQNNG